VIVPVPHPLDKAVISAKVSSRHVRLAEVEIRLKSLALGVATCLEECAPMQEQESQQVLEWPHGIASDEEWSAFRQAAYDRVVDNIKLIDIELATEPHRRTNELGNLKREHHLVVIADRIRRTSPGLSHPSAELRQTAEFILDRSAFIAAQGANRVPPRTAIEERMLVSGRVNWHKLMRRANSRAGTQGGWLTNSRTRRGSNHLLRQIANPKTKPAVRGVALLKYIRERLEHLVSVSNEVTGSSNCALSRRDRLLLRDLESVLMRARGSDNSRGVTSPKNVEGPK
jgi:hypothetical protein